MTGAVHKAVRSGKLRLGDWLLDCHVLADGRRVISQRAFLTLFDIHSGRLDAANALVDSLKHALLAMMRGSHDWAFFKRLVDRSFPKLGQTYLLNLGEELPPGDSND